MSNIESSNKTIAKNTIMLYLRMLIMTLVGLYTSRVILMELGASDYGIFNVVGGFVSMLAYLNTVFIDASQRFISVSLGYNDIHLVRRTFTTSLMIHIIIAILLLIVAETVGLWFVNTRLNIPSERIYAANWVFQCSVLSLLVTIINIPYRSMIVAKEHMQIYAYVSIVEAIMKLGIVLILQFIPYDKLIVYSLLYLIVSILLPLYYMVYCRTKFTEVKFMFSMDRGIFKEMLSYSGWVVIGNLGFTFKDQFSNILINIFCGTIVNASRGIAAQVNGVVTSFANNFLMALSPQITKQFSAGNTKRSFSLVCSGARYAFYLMSIIAIPILLNINCILDIWLDDVPEYTAQFVSITIISSVIYASSKTLTVCIQAGGDIKLFQIGISIIMLIELPMAFIILKAGLKPYYATLPAIITNILGVFFRLYIAKKKVSFNLVPTFIKEVFGKCMPLMLLVYAISYLIGLRIEDQFLYFFVTSFSSIIFATGLIYFLGLNNTEKNLVRSFLFPNKKY